MNKSKNTAISRKQASKPLRDLLKLNLIDGKVLDYGCGRGVDVLHLVNKGFDAYGYDKFHCVKKYTNKFDTIISTYVINVIDNEQERIELVQNAFSQLAQGAKLVITSRTDTEINKLAKRSNWNGFQDGFKTKSGTFQKGFSNLDIVQLVSDSLPTKSFKWSITGNSKYSQVIVSK